MLEVGWELVCSGEVMECIVGRPGKVVPGRECDKVIIGIVVGGEVWVSGKTIPIG